MVRSLLLLCVFAGCAGPRYASIPERPSRPHDFETLTRHWEPVSLPGREKPVVLSWVEKGSGPPLLLVHGLMTSAYSWRYVITALSKQYRVIAVDLPGAGESDAPPELSQDPKAQAELLEAFLAKLGIARAYVVGNSLGGYLTLWWWLSYPERFERLMVIHSPGFPEPRLYAMRAVLHLPGNEALFALITRDAKQFTLDNQHYKDFTLHSKEGIRSYSRWVSIPERRELLRKNLLEAMNPYRMEELPAALAARSPNAPPVRLLWSTQDVLVNPKNGPRYKELLPEAELVWLENTSHFTQVDSPDETVREILRFGN